MRYELIENGNSFTSTGWRNVSFERDLALSPVWFSRSGGYRNQRCTIQVQGPVLASSEWDSREVKFSLSFGGTSYLVETLRHTRKGEEREISKTASTEALATWASLHERHPWLREFLTGGHGREGSYVPYEGEPLALVKKREKYERFHKRFGVDLSRVIDRKVTLEFLPGSKADLDTVEETAVNGSSCHCDASTDISYFGSDGKGRAEKLEFMPSSRGVGPNSNRGSRGKPGVGGWRPWRYVVRVKAMSGHTGRQSHNFTHVQVFDMAA